MLYLFFGGNPPNLPPDCNPGAEWPYTGFAVSEYEYRKSQVGALPYQPLMRGAGQYYDAETDLFENWNRYYNPSLGRYASIEPMLQAPEYVRGMAMSGISVPAYAYAQDNPVTQSDPDGRSIRSTWGFLRNYWNMRQANTIGADKYFHCKANCEASSHEDLFAWSDAVDAKIISEVREVTDETLKGDPRSACDQDRAANHHGQAVPKGFDCKQWCSQFRPAALAPEY